IYCRLQPYTLSIDQSIMPAEVLMIPYPRPMPSNPPLSIALHHPLHRILILPQLGPTPARQYSIRLYKNLPRLLQPHDRLPVTLKLIGNLNYAIVQLATSANVHNALVNVQFCQVLPDSLPSAC